MTDWRDLCHVSDPNLIFITCQSFGFCLYLLGSLSKTTLPKLFAGRGKGYFLLQFFSVNIGLQVLGAPICWQKSAINVVFNGFPLKRWVSYKILWWKNWPPLSNHVQCLNAWLAYLQALDTKAVKNTSYFFSQNVVNSFRQENSLVCRCEHSTLKFQFHRKRHEININVCIIHTHINWKEKYRSDTSLLSLNSWVLNEKNVGI